MFELPAFEKAKVLVIGDVMLDSYWHGPVSRISPEAPVPVLNIANMDKRPGGAANVALNIRSLGAEVLLMGIVGEDLDGQFVETSLAEAGIQSDMIQLANQSTIVKLRVISQHQQLMRLDFDDDYQGACKHDLIQRYEDAAHAFDVIVLSDYGKGTLSDIKCLIRIAKQKNKCVLIDPKSSDFDKYNGATLLTPNSKEFEAVVGCWRNEEEFLAKGQGLLESLSLQALLVTRGAKGMTLFQENSDVYHLEANTKDVFDVTGAGDTVIGVLSACMAANASLSMAVTIANHAAGIVVGYLGASHVSKEDLNALLTQSRVLSYSHFEERLKTFHAMSKSFHVIEINQKQFTLETFQYIKHLKNDAVHIIVVVKQTESVEPGDVLLDILSSFTLIDNIFVVKDDEIDHIRRLDAYVKIPTSVRGGV